MKNLIEYEINENGKKYNYKDELDYEGEFLNGEKIIQYMN